jgi:hypothetical protein
MSVYNCEFPEYFNCHLTQYRNPEAIFRKNIQPEEKTGFIYLNPQVYTEKFSDEFTYMNVNKEESKEYIPLKNGWLQPGEGKQVFTLDPRLNSASHGQWTTLDKPPIDSSMKLYDIPFDKRLDKYGQNYRTYSDINAGQIMYYIDKSIEDAYFKPIFTNSSSVNSYLYQDPMGTIMAGYTLTPLKSGNFIGPERNDYIGELSWIEDSSNQREDILSFQAPRRKRWSARYAK